MMKIIAMFSSTKYMPGTVQSTLLGSLKPTKPSEEGTGIILIL